MRRRLGSILVLLAAVTSLSPAPSRAEPTDPVRILIIGDSVAQGSAGDWTWRYRVWQALTAAGVEFDLVGPRDDLFDIVTSTFGSQAYADPSFDRDHAARWGMALAFPDETMVDLMTDYRPDIVIETRGFNDLTWLQGQPADVRAAMADEIEAARGVDPAVDFVLGELPQVWEANVGSFSADLPGFAATQSEGASQVVAAVPDGVFVEGVDTWDRAHYSATGEVKFAAGIVDALGDLGVGTGYPRPLPKVVDGHWGAATLAVVAGDGSASLTWQRPEGPFWEYIWLRDLTAGEPWARLKLPVEGESWSTSGLVNGHRYAFRLQSAKGEAISVSYSNEVRVVPNPPAPGAPTGMTTTPGPHRLAVAWRAATGATSYVVSWKGAVTGDHGSRTVTSRATVLSGLLAGERYDVTVTPLNDTVRGPVAGASARPTGPVPPRPRGLVAARSAPHRATLRWRPAAHATSYAVWQRAGASWSLVRTTTSTTMTVRAVPPGAVSFKVRAWHQLLPGGWSAAVRLR